MLRTTYLDYDPKIPALGTAVAREAMSVRVIGKRFNNPTVRDLTATANLNHTLKL
jgi:hypothetical protein